MSHDVVLSYSSIDKKTADAVCHGLESRGIRCWMAPRDIIPSSNYAASILKAIEQAKVLVLLLSSHANDSRHVLTEVERAFHHRLAILPFRIEDVSPSDDLQFFVSTSHWLDAITLPLRQHIEKLTEVVSCLLVENAIKTPPTSDSHASTQATSNSTGHIPAKHKSLVSDLRIAVQTINRPTRVILLIAFVMTLLSAIFVQYDEQASAPFSIPGLMVSAALLVLIILIEVRRLEHYIYIFLSSLSISVISCFL